MTILAVMGDHARSYERLYRLTVQLVGRQVVSREETGCLGLDDLPHAGVGYGAAS